ncbi:transient receptor potential cation channel subfamily M member 1-like isoform X2 [Symsagittifera roscoffensis]|uniref:transient receptor potential cation channel subfamily M member 1-like isoform X2 n=1 Tax=Symsagittifera roscoffensis TaxID=84072 RepID=UPI00307BC645
MCQELVSMFPQNEVSARAEMQENSNVFRTLSLSLIDCYWKTSQSVTEKLLCEVSRVTDFKSIVDVASFVDLKEFIAKPCVQKLLESEWKGGMRLTLVEVVKHMLTPFLISKPTEPTAERNKKAILEEFLNENQEYKKPVFKISTVAAAKKRMSSIRKRMQRKTENDDDEVSSDKRLAALLLRSHPKKQSSTIIDSVSLAEQASENGSMKISKQSATLGHDDGDDDTNDEGIDSEMKASNSEDFLANFAEISERTTTVRPSLNRKGGRSQLEECLPESVWLGMQGGHQGSRRPAAREGTWDMDELEEMLEHAITMEGGDYESDNGSTTSDKASSITSSSSISPSLAQSILNYYRAPVTKFVLYLFAYLGFLFVVTMAAFEVNKGRDSVFGIVAFLFMASYAIESYRQLCFQQVTWRLKLKLWAMNEWNLIEWTYLTIGMTAYPLATVDHDKPHFQFLSMLMYVVTMFMMYVRLLRFYQCSSRLGPMWIMIRRMLVETLIALCVFGVILVALGICFFAINVPLHEEDNHVIGHNGQVAKRDPKYEGYYSYSWIFLRPYFMMLGKYFSKLNANGRNVTVTKLMSVAFMFIGNALMMNLLIAMYKGIFDHVIEKADEEWKTEMYWLNHEFKGKTILPPPFSIFESVWLIGCKLFCCCKKNGRPKHQRPSKQKRQLRQMLEVFERHCVAEMLKRNVTESSPDDVIREMTHDRMSSIGEIDDSMLSVIRLTEEQASKREEKKEALRILFLKSIR